MSTLVFDEVTRRYGDVVALNRVNLEVGPGITALVGPNGAGKSTFMRLATGHSKPSTGRVTAFGEDVWDNPNVLGRMGFVPEQDAFYEFMTGLDFVASLARLQGFTPHDALRAAEEELEQLGLGDAMHRPIKGYSKGMRQRAKLAQALVHEPDLLLLDEPLLGCDPIARRRIGDRITQLKNQGCAVLVSTHILPEVERMTRDIAIMHGGRISATGSLSQVRAAMTDSPSRIRVLTHAPRKVATAVAGWKNVDGVHIRDGAVDVEANALMSFLGDLQSKNADAWKLAGWEIVDSDLDSLFGYITGGKQ